MKYKDLYMDKKQKKVYEDYANKSGLVDKKLSVCEVTNGVILPARENNSYSSKVWAIGGVIDETGNFVEESSSWYLFGGNYEYNEDFVDNYDEEVIFMGPFLKHWGHFICDQISRLWYILNAPSKYKIAYCGWNWNCGLSDMSGNYLELMELLGVKKEQLVNIQRPTRFKKVIIPNFSFFFEGLSRYYTKEFIQITDKIVSNVKMASSNCPKNIYFTRLSFSVSNEKERGELQIVEYLKKKGFVVVSPEKLSLKEQIFYLNHCENICMISGSISHNLMFAKSENNMIILNKTNLINSYQMLIDHITKANVIYIDIYKKIFHVLFGMGPFLMDVNKNLHNWGGTISLDNSRLTLKDYLWYFKTYYRIYKDKNNKRLLKRQKKAFIQNDKLNIDK